ncbi:MAG: DUF4349 domain-containing protein [Candidatus Izimaplasma sp.]|nr:DUF4349 domain-containing protein [Candidatus Izimaplasma bacterium]
MSKTIKSLILVFFIAFLVSCSSRDINYDPSDYHDTEQGGVEETPTYSKDDADLSGGGEILQVGDTPSLPERKIIYEADVALLSDDIETTYDSILTTLNDYSAYIEAEAIDSDSVDVVIRVLSDEFTDLIGELKTSGELLSYSKTSEDITNAYSTYEARLAALNTQHDRILLLMEQATDIDDIIKLENQLVDIESELNEIGQKLATYDSLVDYSTINLSIDYIYDLASILPKSAQPGLNVIEVLTDMIIIDVQNNSEKPTTLFINVKDNGEVIQQYEREATGESVERFNIGDLKSGTKYQIEVTSLENNSTLSNERTIFKTTDPTFGSVIVNTFNASVDSLVFIGKGIVLVSTALIPYIIVGTLIFVPLYKIVIKPHRIKKANNQQPNTANDKT